MLLAALGLGIAVSAPALQDLDTAATAPAAPTPATPTRRAWTIACLGDSITAVNDTLPDAVRMAWTHQLSERLNVELQWEQHRVTNFGVGGATLLRDGDRPMHETEAYAQAMGSGFDHLVVMLGTNDTVEHRRGNWRKNAAWEEDLGSLVADARARRPDAKIWLLGPPPMFPDQPGLSEARAQSLTARAPRIAELQERTRAFAATRDGVAHLALDGVLQRGQTTDGVHPDCFGNFAIADLLHRALAPDLGLPVDLRASINPAPAAEFRGGAGWGGTWWKALDDLEQLQRELPLGPDVVFFGDSITQGLTGHAQRRFEIAGRDAVSLGLSGDRTEHLRYRLRQGLLRGWSPRVIVLQIGINNLNAAGHSAADTAAGIHAVVDDLRARHPFACILVCGPFPAGRAAASGLRRKVNAVHDGIVTIGEGTEVDTLGGYPQVRYVDLRGLFLDDGGAPNQRMAADALHINGQGKQAWLAALAPWIEAECTRVLVPELPTTLAWLRDNDDAPLVSRSLFELRPGDAGPRLLAKDLLYSFDTADPTDLAALANGGWAVNCPISSSRSAPNVGTALQLIEADRSKQTVRVACPRFAVSPNGQHIVTARLGQVSLVDRGTAEAQPLLDAQTLGRTMPRGLRWLDDATVELDLGPVGGGTSGAMSPGRWQVAIADGTFARLPPPPATGAPPPAAPGAVDPSAQELEDGSILFLDVDGRLRRAAGPRARSPLHNTLADPQLVLPAFRIEEFRARGGWVVIGTISQQWSRRIHVVRLDTGQHHELGPGSKPRWGRGARK
ncbi:MAG: GDSL-type esterase/lipase family protein [Planctomycetota bacterium]